MSSHSFYRTVLSASILSLAGLATVTAAQEAHPPHWTYEGKEGPEKWGSLDSSYAACSMSHAESPIEIKDARKTDLPALKFDYQSVPLNIVDNGHTIEINYAPGSTLTVGEEIYTLKQFHFHHPSEEHVDGKGFPLVAHLVHADARGRLAVVAILFVLGSANPLIDALWENIPSEKEKPHDIPSVSIQARDLLPDDRGYFTYTGSLTTPPCSEGVSWYVLKRYVTVSPKQVASFAKIYPMNARPIQPTYSREILQSR